MPISTSIFMHRLIGLSGMAIQRYICSVANNKTPTGVRPVVILSNLAWLPMPLYCRHKAAKR